MSARDSVRRSPAAFASSIARERTRSARVQLAGIAKCSAEIRGEREAAWLVVAEERAREQSDGRGHISTSRGPPARGGQEVGHAGRKGPV